MNNGNGVLQELEENKQESASAASKQHRQSVDVFKLGRGSLG
mgnify:CR=1 FL=1